MKAPIHKSTHTTVETKGWEKLKAGLYKHENGAIIEKCSYGWEIKAASKYDGYSFSSLTYAMNAVANSKLSFIK